jgi:hypothetical protein
MAGSLALRSAGDDVVAVGVLNRIKNPAALLVGLALSLLGLGSSHGQALLAPSPLTSGLIERTDVFIKVDGLAEGGRAISGNAACKVAEAWFQSCAGFVR